MPPERALSAHTPRGTLAPVTSVSIRARVAQRDMLMIFLPLVVSFTLSTRLPSDPTRAARSPAPAARLSEEPGGCNGPRILRVDEGRDESTLTLPLEVFTTPGCPYCARAKRFFKRHSLPYTERDVSADEAVLREMIERASVATCPQIFVAGKLVGGQGSRVVRRAGGCRPRAFVSAAASGPGAALDPKSEPPKSE